MEEVMPMGHELPSPPPDRRRRRWLQLHETIYDAACVLFRETGIDDTSVAQIAERADVARKTVFNHFPRKRDFISEWGRRRRSRALERLSPEVLSQGGLQTVLEHYYTELAKLFEEDRVFEVKMLLGWRSIGGPFDEDPHPQIEQVVEFVALARERGEVRRDVNPRWIGIALYSSYFGIVYEWCKGEVDEPPFDLQEALIEIVDTIVGGLIVTS